MKQFFSKFSRRTWIIVGIVAAVLLVAIFSFSRNSGTEFPSGSNEELIYGNIGTSSAGIPVQCNQAVGNVHISAGSFSGAVNIKTSCVNSNQITELDKLVKAKTGNTNEVLGAITLEPSPFSFNNDVTVIIPLLSQRQDLAGQYHDLYVYAPNVSGGLLPVNQALIASDGWNGTANSDHFSTFVLSIPIVKIGDMAKIPAGEFQMGSNQGESDEQPAHKVSLSTFFIDAYEVTNGQYERCVKSGRCTEPHKLGSPSRPSYYGNADFADYPVIYVDWNQAATYCVWAGKRLPTEAEWEKAARGIDGRTYPWGNVQPNSNLLNYDSNVGDTTMVGSYPKGASPYGVYDMAGNVYEWVNDWYRETYYETSPSNNPLGPEDSDSSFRTLRGGSWSYYVSYVRSADRSRLYPVDESYLVGFRCVVSLP